MAEAQKESLQDPDVGQQILKKLNISPDSELAKELLKLTQEKSKKDIYEAFADAFLHIITNGKIQQILQLRFTNPDRAIPESALESHFDINEHSGVFTFKASIGHVVRNDAVFDCMLVDLSRNGHKFEIRFGMNGATRENVNFGEYKVIDPGFIITSHSTNVTNRRSVFLLDCMPGQSSPQLN